jgi:hypothetical protein
MGSNEPKPILANPTWSGDTYSDVWWGKDGIDALMLPRPYGEEDDEPCEMAKPKAEVVA